MEMEETKLPLWPFFVADVVLLSVAAAIGARAHHPWMWWEAGSVVCCGVGAAAALITPFLWQARRDNEAAQTTALARISEELRQAEQLAAEISGAARQWSQSQEQAARSASSAAALSETISAATALLAESLRKGGDAEKNHLRLENEKLRRGEGEWLHVAVHILDHVYALSQAARHSGQPALAEQISQFQNSCREVARRVGLIAAVAAEGERFDPKQHQLRGVDTAPENAIVAETLAAGYTYQGQLVRRALVSLAPTTGAEH